MLISVCRIYPRNNFYCSLGSSEDTLQLLGLSSCVVDEQGIFWGLENLSEFSKSHILEGSGTGKQSDKNESKTLEVII